MNQDQVLGLARNLVAFLGGFAVSRGWFTTEQITMIGGIAAAVIPFVWTLFVHTDSAKIAAVTAMPDIRQVVVNTSAKQDTAASVAASDPLQPKVTK